MKKIFSKSLLLLFVGLFNLNYFGQSNKILYKTSAKNYPGTFSILKNEFNKLFSYERNSVINMKENKYLDNARVLYKEHVGENKQLKLKLNYFSNSYLTVQVNGNDSQIIFVMSYDNSVFYKSRTEAKEYVMTKCDKAEIISE